MQMRGRKMNLNISTEEKLLGMPDFVATAIDLEEGLEASFHMLNLMQQSVQPFHMKVDKKETIEVPKGSYECYKVHIKPTEGSAPEQTLYFSAEEPHKLIKKVNELPPAMGGATIITELK